MCYYTMKCLLSIEKKAVSRWRIWPYAPRTCSKNPRCAVGAWGKKWFFQKLKEEFARGALVLQRMHRRKERGLKIGQRCEVIPEWWRRIRLVKKHGGCMPGGRNTVSKVRYEMADVWRGASCMADTSVGRMGGRWWGSGQGRLCMLHWGEH